MGSSPKDAAHWLVPTGRSWQSIVAGYLGLVTLVIWILGPVATAIGIWALRRAAREGTHGGGRAIFGIVAGALSTTLLVAVLATI
ncbi:DUF4190 domain-containing protein [Symbioplanes lichenis]|uniref:DUF4190 domain-containing protein n=1 Tax=Symbioplanes lichenis TaxID=1629072 RepID=UPI002738C87C|nr:DUF4190 domain-containing protein [Actinoplanes lichenis]